MMNKTGLFFAASVSLGLLVSCSARPACDVKTINVDLSSAVPTAVDTTRMVALETSDSALIFGVDQLIHAWGRYIVASRNLLKIYDASTGRYIADLARYNTGESGFSNISTLWSHGDTVLLFDSNARSVSRYLPDGTFVGRGRVFEDSEIRSGQPPRVYHEMADGCIITVNGSTGGSTPDNPLLTIYDRNHRHLRALPGREVRESAYLMDGSYYDSAGKRLLFWEPLRDTIFSADADCGIRPLYAVDFGENAFPQEFQNIPYLSQRARAFSAGRAGAPYASMLRYVQADGDGDLYFALPTASAAAMWRATMKRMAASVCAVLPRQMAAMCKPLSSVLTATACAWSCATKTG